jgi:type VI secretion system protein ImpK
VAWNHKSRWRPELLQRLYYNSTDAGEKFFERLNRVGLHQKGIREVYYLCLALGFSGRYCTPEDKIALQQLKEHHLKLLFDGAPESPSLVSFEQHALFPDALSGAPVAKAPKMASRRTFWAVTIGAPVAVCILLFAAYRYALYSVGENILRAIQQL